MFKIYFGLFLIVSANCQVDWTADQYSERWMAYSKATIKKSLSRRLNGNIAKNVILFLGDGMGPTTVTSGRIWSGQKKGKNGEEEVTVIDNFDHVALSKTYNIDAQTPDSAGTATAFLSGVKTRIGAIGVDGRAVDCKTTLTSEVDSILQWAHYAGKSTGIVTTTRITHATPAGAYSHVYARDLEAYDRLFPPADFNEGCRDIADQLVSRHNYINVVLGGGLRKFIRAGVDQGTIISGCNGDRIDDRNLINEWKHNMTEANKRHIFLTTRNEFMGLNLDDYDHVFGLFNCDHMSYEVDRIAQNPIREPSISEMTEMAIKMLSRNPNGFFLLVEGGRIDHAHHDTRAKRALEEFVAFDLAIGRSLSLVDLAETHITVTADHSHVFTIGGYSKRGNPLFGIVVSVEDALSTNKTTYTSLLYGNGPGALFSPRATNLTNAQTESINYRQEAAVHVASETHGGEDVAIYGVGPMSYLYDGTVEQSHVAHVMAYAACIGPYNSTNDPECETNRGYYFETNTSPSSSSSSSSSSSLSSSSSSSSTTSSTSPTSSSTRLLLQSSSNPTNPPNSSLRLSANANTLIQSLLALLLCCIF